MNATVWVSWYDHDCGWISKYCYEYHRKSARLPLDLLEHFELIEAEERWFPITVLGDEWAPRSEAEADTTIADHARPDHYVHEPHNADMDYPIHMRAERRYVGPWVPIEAPVSAGSDE